MLGVVVEDKADLLMADIPMVWRALRDGQKLQDRCKAVVLDTGSPNGHNDK